MTNRNVHRIIYDVVTWKSPACRIGYALRGNFISQSVIMWTRVVHSGRNLILKCTNKTIKLNVTRKQYDNKAKSNYHSKITAIQYITKFFTVIFHQLQQYYVAVTLSLCNSEAQLLVSFKKEYASVSFLVLLLWAPHIFKECTCHCVIGLAPAS